MESSKPLKNRMWWKLLIAGLRIALGGVFVFSGFVKGVDLWGVFYKFDDYITAFGWEWARPFSGFAAALLPLVEFVLGFLLMIGSLRRLTVVLLLLLMLPMLCLTGYIALFDPISDCGCFGEAVSVSNTATFWKNVVLTAGLCFLFKYNKTLRSFYGPAVQWITVILPVAYLLIIMALGYFVQPLLDFRSYPVGSNVVENEEPDDFVFIYEKDGITKEFGIDSLPDNSWKFVDRKVADSGNMEEKNSPIAIFDDGRNIAGEVIPAEGDVMLLLIADVAEINAALTFRINEMYEQASAAGIVMVCLTSGSDEEVAEWKEISMADYPVYRMDGSELKTIARGNPALVSIRDGRILWKSTLAATDVEDLISEAGFDEQEIGMEGEKIIAVLTVALFAASFLLFLVNRSILLIKFGRRLRRNQNKDVNLRGN